MDKSVKGKNITVVGAARSGLAVAQLLSKQGANVFVTDNGNSELLQKNISEL